MARLEIESEECQDISLGRWLDVVAGDRFAFASVRGENYVIPGVPGQTWAPKQEDHLIVTIGGPIWGLGATAALRRASFATNLDGLRDALSAVGELVDVVAYPPNMALATGETASIEAELLRFVISAPEGWEQATIEMDLRCISDPLGWTVEEGS